VNWALWNYPQTTGLTGGAATGSTSDVGVTYSGNVNASTQIGGFVWLPTSTFSGGTVADAPTNNTEITLTGGAGTATNTIAFSQAVTDPVLAIASLGQGGINAQFDFLGSPSFAIEAGGPSANFGGSSIVMCGSNVCGQEGSGVIQFFGTFSSISWTNPVFEDYYLITVGDEGLASVVTGATVPESSTWAMALIGFAGLGFTGWRGRRRLARGRLRRPRELPSPPSLRQSWLTISCSSTNVAYNGPVFPEDARTQDFRRGTEDDSAGKARLPNQGMRARLIALATGQKIGAATNGVPTP
jgi:hypothetical protein